MTDGPDLSHFVQHRQLDGYEQGMARLTYAYGVDLRRSRWLANSSLGNPLVRAVDRAWPTLADHLMQESFADRLGSVSLGTRSDHSTELLGEVAAHMQLLRAPLPTVRWVRHDQRGRWPLVTPLGATRGGATWLALDADGLAALDAGTRAFLIGSGLGHLHCDHAVFFTTHLLAGRREANLRARAVRAAMAPWTSVLAFSADRAGLLCCGSLEHAISVIENPPVPVGEGAAELEPSWWPRMATTSERVHALQEFARSAVFIRVTAMRARQRDLSSRSGSLPDLAREPGALPAREASEPAGEAPEPDAAPTIHVPADAWSLARVDARLTARLGLM